MSTVQAGRGFEEVLVKYLRRNKYLVLARNTNFFALAEMDVLVAKNRVIYFIEVKKRSRAFCSSDILNKIIKQKQVLRQRLVINKFSMGKIMNAYDFKHVLCIGSCCEDLKFFELDFDFFNEIYL